MVPSPEELNTAEAQPLHLSITSGPTSSLLQVPRYQFFPPQPPPETEIYLVGVQCPAAGLRKSLHFAPPAGGWLPLPSTGGTDRTQSSQDAEKPGLRAQRGVATAGIADLVLEGARGREARQQRSRPDPRTWPTQSSAVAADASTRFQICRLQHAHFRFRYCTSARRSAWLDKVKLALT